MVLSDRDIKEAIHKGELTINPYNPQNIQPASIDLTISNHFLTLNPQTPHINPLNPHPQLTQQTTTPPNTPFILQPNMFALGSTQETITIPDTIVGRLEGKSSLGRLGLLIHSTAGFIDPGFHGTLTLELANIANKPIHIHPGMLIGQISFLRMLTRVQNPYGSPKLKSKYQNQQGPTPSQGTKNTNPKHPKLIP